MPEDLAARGEPAHEEKTPVWVDWSGETAVWVCQVCGAQGLGGFTAADGRWAALAHRSSFHPETPVSKKVWTTPVACAWAETTWAELRGGETCSKDTFRGQAYCSTHASQNWKYESNGVCEFPGCHLFASAFPKQPLCKSHAKEWSHTLETFEKRKAVLEGRYLWTSDQLGRWKGGPVAGQFQGERPTKQVAKHGVRSGYKAGCRCAPCSQAQSEYSIQARRKRLQRGGLS